MTKDSRGSRNGGGGSLARHHGGSSGGLRAEVHRLPRTSHPQPQRRLLTRRPPQRHQAACQSPGFSGSRIPTPCMCTRTPMYVYTHACRHSPMCMHTRVHTHVHRCTHACNLHMSTRVHAHVCAHTYICTHVNKYSSKCSHVCTCTHVL